VLISEMINSFKEQSRQFKSISLRLNIWNRRISC